MLFREHEARRTAARVIGTGHRRSPPADRAPFARACRGVPEGLSQRNISNCSIYTSSGYYCAQCYSGYYLSSDQSYCYSCPTGCSTCQSSFTCNSCSGGYYLSAGNCFKCGSNCQTCTSNTLCTNCYSGYFVTGTYSCQSCLTDCSSCTNATTCDSCIMGYAKQTNPDGTDFCKWTIMRVVYIIIIIALVIICIPICICIFCVQSISQRMPWRRRHMVIDSYGNDPSYFPPSHQTYQAFPNQPANYHSGPSYQPGMPPAPQQGGGMANPFNNRN